MEKLSNEGILRDGDPLFFLPRYLGKISSLTNIFRWVETSKEIISMISLKELALETM